MSDARVPRLRGRFRRFSSAGVRRAGVFVPCVKLNMGVSKHEGQGSLQRETQWLAEWARSLYESRHLSLEVDVSINMSSRASGLIVLVHGDMRRTVCYQSMHVADTRASDTYKDEILFQIEDCHLAVQWWCSPSKQAVG